MWSKSLIWICFIWFDYLHRTTWHFISGARVQVLACPLLLPGSHPLRMSFDKIRLGTRLMLGQLHTVLQVKFDTSWLISWSLKWGRFRPRAGTHLQFISSRSRQVALHSSPLPMPPAEKEAGSVWGCLMLVVILELYAIFSTLDSRVHLVELWSWTSLTANPTDTARSHPLGSDDPWPLCSLI